MFREFVTTGRLLSASTNNLASQPVISAESKVVDFARIARLLAQRTGAAAEGGCSELLRERVNGFIDEHGNASLDGLLQDIERGDHGALERLTRLLAVSCNGFFRGPSHFEALATHLRSRPAYRPIEIWCASCSSGEDLYSIIITACEVFGTLAPPIHVVASEHGARLLNVTRNGNYSRAQIENLPTPIRRRFFRATPPHGETVQVRAELRALVTFRQIDLRTPAWPMRPHFDVIFCRGMLHTLEWPQQANAYANFDELLDDDGLLFVGPDDQVERANSTLVQVAPALYRKKR